MSSNSSNQPLLSFFNIINAEVSKFNRLLSSNGFKTNQKEQTRDVIANRNNQTLADVLPQYIDSTFLDGGLFHIVPPVDILEDEDNYELHITVPGVDKEVIDLHYDGERNFIKVSGEIPSHKDEDNLKVKERSTGKFERIITFPKHQVLDGENIQASIKNGVLCLIVPKLTKEVSGLKKIKIQSSDTL